MDLSKSVNCFTYFKRGESTSELLGSRFFMGKLSDIWRPFSVSE